MSDFVAFSEEIENGMAFLEHHQILGGKWGVMNGPPYPLGKGDHSASEKKAAKAAGIKVGSDSGKGSIENVKTSSGSRSKSPKKPLTPEEKREKALEAARSGDAKKIAKNIDQLSTDELRDATDRARYKNQLADENARKEKMSKAEMDKQDAIRSGDKEKVKEYADKMSYQELSEAMNKVNLMQQLNYQPPPPSAMDKLKNVANKLDDVRQVSEKAINAYNVAASIYNSTHKGGNQWPIIEKKVNNPQQSKEQQVAQNILNQVQKDVQNTVQQNKQKSYEEQSNEKLRNAKIDYQNQKKYEEWVAKQEKKNAPKEEKSNETNESNRQQPQPEQNNTPKPQPNQNTNQAPQPNESQRQYTPERAPQTKRAFFNTKKSEESTENKEPTEEQKRLVEEARKSDDYYLNQMREISNQPMSNSDSSWESTWNSVEQASSNSRPISDDLTPAEQEYLDSFNKR